MKRESMVDNTELLLFDILQELKKLNDKSETKETKTTCKHCGGIHENKGQMMACAKKHKKEGVNK